MKSQAINRALSGVLLLGLPAFLACDRDIEPEDRELESPELGQELTRTNEPSTNQQTAAPGTQANARDSITEARCKREQVCGNIAPGEDYASMDECKTKISAEWADDLNIVDCPGGIVQKELAECLEEIRNEDCASPFDTLGRVAACRESDLCKALGNL